MIAWFIVASLIIGVAGFTYGDSPLFGNKEFLEIDTISLIMTAILIFATFATAFLHHKRLLALIIIGVVGLIVSLIFIKFSAPDLALTQLSVEVVTIVLILLAIFYSQKLCISILF